MPTLKETEEKLEAVSTIKNIVQSYQEIANLRMNAIREKVLKNRKFFLELSETYQKIRAAYLFSIKKGWIKEKESSFLRPEKETVAIFLSANKFFYGPLILNTWQQVQKNIEGSKTDLVVTGKVGKYLAGKNKPRNKIFYFELDDENPEPEQIKKIMDFIKNYKDVLVFHGRYRSVLKQTVTINKISGGLPAVKSPEDIEVKNYLFEPSAEAILEFFEREIIASLFNQTLLEHQLARYASRMIAMHQATENAKKSRKELKRIENKLQKQEANKKQIELFNSINV